ncbi:MAG: glycosyltransferase family 2 protein [Alphaproteobacteria bacterium]|nr:glycosyltransferase family 2 protein [Alphaproteobacteria bacterium]
MNQFNKSTHQGKALTSPSRQRTARKTEKKMNASLLSGQKMPPTERNIQEREISAADNSSDAIFHIFAKSLIAAERNRPLHTKLGDILLKLFRPRLAAAKILRRSPFFDEIYYLSAYADVAAAGADPALHYYLHGASEGRNPGPHFNTEAMRGRILGETDRKTNPLLEYHRRLRRGLSLLPPRPINKMTAKTDADRKAIKLHIGAFRLKAKIAVVMPVYNTEPDYLREAIRSVQRQVYSNWELCIANDASTNSEIKPILDKFAAEDSRIKVIHRATNGHISEATNTALEHVSAEFTAFMDHDDLIDDLALYEIAAAVEANPKAELIYSDLDRIKDDGTQFNPFFKPDFSPDLLLGQNMISHLTVYRTDLLRKLGCLRKGFEGSQDYDLALRATENMARENIVHIPAILYHWRAGGRTKSFSEAQLERCVRAARKAITEHLVRKEIAADVLPVDRMPHYNRIKRHLPVPAPMVSIIIPTRNQGRVLKLCLDGILGKTDYPNFEVVVVDHESTEKDALDVMKNAAPDPRVRIIPFAGQFNYSKINNMAVAQARGSILALLNNDVEVMHADWLSEMVSHAVRPEVGAVGAKLYYPDGRLQHAGVVVGLGGTAGHSFLRAAGSCDGYVANCLLTRNVSAVTAACLLVAKEKFLQVGGFNEEKLPVAFNDVDLCLKLADAGYLNVWTPFAELIHHESLTRGPEDTIEKQLRSRREVEYLNHTWAKYVANDPFYNPNLSLKHADFQFEQQSRRVKPWAKYL